MERFILLVFFVLLSFSSINLVFASETTSNLDDQTSVFLTIYNSNIALVKDQRTIKLPDGVYNLKFMDVASKIKPETVYIKSTLNPQSLSILEQNYEYDLLNPEKLMDKYVGKEVKLYSKNYYTDKEEIVTALLLSNNQGRPVLKIGNEITFGHSGRMIFPGIPENLISKPTLVWLLNNSLKEAQKLEVSYLTEGISWKSDYVLVISRDDKSAGLQGWVTLNNTSGTMYKNAGLKLVAGDVNRVYQQRVYEADGLAKAGRVAAAPAQFKEESFFEYHLYTLDRKTTVKDNQTKQVSLVEGEDIKVEKQFIYKGMRDYYYSNYTTSSPFKTKVGVFITLWNKKENNLGIPLPKGIVRAYKMDEGSNLQFIGEDSIDHTPKDEKITIKLGEAFDIVAEKVQTDWKKISADTYEAAYTIKFRNHKKEDITIRVIEPVPGDWRMLESSHKHEKTTSSTAEFNIPVAKDKEEVLSYRVMMRY